MSVAPHHPEAETDPRPEDGSAALRTLTDEARSTAERLEAALSASEVAGLDERLKLGARMLKALQLQIERGDGTAGALEGHGTRMETMRSRLEVEAGRSAARVENAVRSLVAEARTRIDDAGAAAVARAERSVQDARDRSLDALRERAAAAQRELDAALESEAAQARARLADTIREASRGADRVHERLAELELGVAELGEAASGAAEMTRDIRAQSADLEAALTRAADGLDTHLDAARVEGEQLAARAAAASARLDERERGLQAAEERARTMERRLGELAGQLPALAQTAHTLEDLLTRLEPWRRILMPDERLPDGTPRAVVDLVDGVRRGLGRDLSALSEALRDVANRVDEAAPESPPEVEVVTRPEEPLRFTRRQP